MLWMNIKAGVNNKMKLDEKTTSFQKMQKEYLQTAVKKCSGMIKKYSDVKGRVHRDIWHYYMGKLCAYQQMLDYLEEKDEQ